MPEKRRKLIDLQEELASNNLPEEASQIPQVQVSSANSVALDPSNEIDNSHNPIGL